jgi:hypothetical protein
VAHVVAPVMVVVEAEEVTEFYLFFCHTFEISKMI